MKVKSWSEYVRLNGDSQMVISGNADIKEIMEPLIRLYLIYKEWIKDEEESEINYYLNIVDGNIYLSNNPTIWKFPNKRIAIDFMDTFFEELNKYIDLFNQMG